MTRILLLEDDPDQLDIRKLLLESAGYEVHASSSALEAATVAPDSDLILMDLVPGWDELIAGLPATTRVIVLSGRDATEALTARSACVLRKPYPTRSLMETISRVCAGA